MSIVKSKSLGYTYTRYNDNSGKAERIEALKDVDIDVQQGDFIAVLGHNGSGKSTLARHMNALLLPSSGTMWIDGESTKEVSELWHLRQKSGMVFQNPDNQIIGNVVQEDTGFGPENIGVPTEEIWKRVEKSLESVGMLSCREKSPNKLSGGQKQRVAIAGILAMHPQCIVLDEPTAMIDPDGRKEVLQALFELNKSEGVTVILITHYMEEAVGADKVYVMDSGKIIMSGTPREIFSRVEELESYRLCVPNVTKLAYELSKSGLDIPCGIITKEELVDEIIKIADSFR